MGSVPYLSDMEVFQKAASLAKNVMKRNPKHPGAIHYFIHANDEPNYAAQAKQAADLYAKVALDAAHALHMPSHIYLALGLWDEVVGSNEVSFQASVTRKQKKNLDYNGLGFHSFHWLQYGYLQQGRYEDAERLLKDIIFYTQESPTLYSRSHQVFMKTTYFAETEDWGNPLADIKTDHEGFGNEVKSRDNFVHAIEALHEKDFEKVESLIAFMDEDRIVAAKTISLDTGIALCSSGGASRSNATPRGIKIAETMALELKALLAWGEKDLIKAEQLLKKATALEEEVGSAAGPPSIVKPSHELYAEFLMENGRAEEAITYYDAALKLAPNRLKSVTGKKNAKERLKQQAKI